MTKTIGDQVVELENFRGPLDLLLHLVREQEMEITDVALGRVCDQYLTTLERMRELDIDIAGDFLVIASTLMLIKSRSILPREDVDLAEELDPGTLPVDVGHVYYAKEEGPYDDNHLGPLIEEVAWLREADLVVCMEPTDNELQVGAVGSIHATLVFEGRRAHSARPWHGENAVYKAAPLLGRLAAMDPVEVRFDALTFREVATITMVEGGGTRNVVPDRFAINLNYRFAPGKSLDAAVADVERLVDGEADIDFTDLSPSGRVCTDNPLVRSLLARVGKATPKQAWTDVARFSEIGVDAINFGPGATAQAHQRNEGVSVAAIERNYAIMREWLRGGAAG